MSELSPNERQGELPQPLGRRRRSGSRTPVQRFFKRFRRSRRSIRRRVTPIVILLSAVVIVVVLSVGAAVLMTDAINRLETSWNNVNRVIAVISRKPGAELTLTDFNRLKNGMTEVSSAADSVLERTDGISPVVSLVPSGNEQVQLLRGARDLSKAAEQILIGLEPTLNFAVEGDVEESVAAGISSGERVVELLEIGVGRFQRADELLRNARREIEQLPLDNVSPTLLFTVEQFNSYHQQLMDINQLLLNSPELLTSALGIGEERSYIVLSQNSDELRPSGGYISTWGWMTVRNGRIDDFGYDATTTTSPFPPPEDSQFAQSIQPPNWWIRYENPVFSAWDGSWYADFPSTAEMARQYYNAGNNIHAPADGVIAIDMIGFEYILQALEEVAMPEYDLVVTPDNYRELIYEIRSVGTQAGTREVEHKVFIADMYQEIFSNWLRIDQERSSALLGAMLQALQERHIMIYFADSQLNDAIELLSWGGSQYSGVEQDYLMIADANTSPNKSNRSINRSLTYDVTINPDGTLDSRASVSYEYLDSVAAADPAVEEGVHGILDYYNLMQVFVPLGSTFQEMGNMQDLVRTENREAHTIFVTSVDVLYDSIERYQFTYETPPLVEDVGRYKRYRLLLQKQPGILTQPTNVQIALPPGASLIRSEPQPSNIYDLDEQRLDYRFDLATDQWIEVVYQQ